MRYSDEHCNYSAADLIPSASEMTFKVQRVSWMSHLNTLHLKRPSLNAAGVSHKRGMEQVRLVFFTVRTQLRKCWRTIDDRDEAAFRQVDGVSVTTIPRSKRSSSRRSAAAFLPPLSVYFCIILSVLIDFLSFSLSLLWLFSFFRFPLFLEKWWIRLPPGSYCTASTEQCAPSLLVRV